MRRQTARGCVLLEGGTRLCCWGSSPPPLHPPHLLKPLIPPAAAGDVKSGLAGLHMGLPHHPAWFLLDLLVVSVSLIFMWINLVALQQLLCLRWLGSLL